MRPGTSLRIAVYNYYGEDPSALATIIFTGDTLSSMTQMGLK